MKNKKYIIIMAVLIILIILVIIKNKNQKEKLTVDSLIEEISTKVPDILSQTLEDGTKLNTSIELTKEKELNGLKIIKSQITYKDGITSLYAVVENSTRSTIEKQKVEVTLIDKLGNETKKIEGTIKTLKQGETTRIKHISNRRLCKYI